MTVTLPTWHFAPGARIGRSSLTPAVSATVEISVADWLAPDARLLAFDRQVHAAEDSAVERRIDDGAHATNQDANFALTLHGEEPGLTTARRQIGLRYQRLFTRRNAASGHARFDAVLTRHAALHDRTKPLVRADHDHALDVWQWVLRLAPDASEALQIAALFHDIERLASEPERRIEQHASDYLGFKQRHAQRGAAMMLAALAELPIEPTVSARAAALIARHEQPEADLELSLLNDADALSFFALNSPGFLAYFGPEHTRKKVDYTLRRMRSRHAQDALDEVRLEPEIAALIRELQPT
jgi:hypothetical protein